MTLSVGLQEGHPACKKLSGGLVGCWRGYLSGARCRLAYGPADATATHWFYLSATGSPGKSRKRALERVCVCVCVLSLELLLGLTVNRFLTLVSTVTVKSNKRSSIRKTTDANNTYNAMDTGFECHFAVCYSGLGDNKDIVENPLH